MQSEFGTDVTPAVAEIPFDVGIDDEAAAVLAAVVAEAGKLCGHADLRPRRVLRQSAEGAASGHTVCLYGMLWFASVTVFPEPKE